MKYNVSKKRPLRLYRKGYTLVELMTVMAMSSIVLLSVGITLVGSQRGWNHMYTYVHGDIATGAFTARKTFEAVVRKSSMKSETLGDDEFGVYYYANVASSSRLDRYALFYVTDGDLRIDYGQLDENGNPEDASRTVILAEYVENVYFSVDGTCAKMTLVLDNGTESATVVSSAVRYNE